MNNNVYNIPVIPEKIVITGDFPVVLDNIFSQDDSQIVHLHLHNCVEIGYCISGHGFFNIENAHFPFKEGDVVLISPDTIHFAQSTPGTTSFWQYAFIDIETLFAKYISFGLKTALIDIFRRNFGNLYSSSDSFYVHKLVKEIITELKYQKNFFEVKTVANLLELIVTLNRDSEGLIPQFFTKTASGISTIEYMIPAILYIQNNYTKDISIEQLAQVCCMSVRSFLRNFKKIYLVTPYDYTLNLRLSVICSDLKNTNLSINYISYKHGFNSLSSFNRQFKKKYNMSPSVWRKKKKI
ncbi:MAG: AraC family transcriptional regulator [Spirochaetales bacterium]